VANCPQCGAQVPATDMVCPSCGAETQPLPPGANRHEVPPPTYVPLSSSDGLSAVTHEAIGAIQSLVKQGLTTRSIRSLATWAAINVAIWLVYGQTIRQKLTPMLNGPGTHATAQYVVIWGLLAIGLLTGVLALLAFVWRTPAGILFNGISLIGIGIWNVEYDSLLRQALIGTQYHANSHNAGLWVILGICQLSWGVGRLWTFFRVAEWVPQELAGPEQAALESGLRAFVTLPVSPEHGIVSVAWRSMGAGKRYTGKLLDDEAVFVSCRLEDVYVVNRRSPAGLKKFVINRESNAIIQAWLSAEQKEAAS
jgi:zinc-ribbon domain